MKLKFDENGAVVTIEKDGVRFPVYVAEDNTEIEVDVPQLYNKITELNTEAKNYRKEKGALKEKYKIFEGIEDLEAWKSNAEKAIETVKNFDDKQLVDAGKVDEIKQQMKSVHQEEIGQIHESYKGKMVEYEDTIKNKDGMIYNLMVSSKFAQSPWFSGTDPKSTLPPEIAEKYFGKNYKVEDDGRGGLRVTGYKGNGQPIYSRKNPGELAEFEEALDAIIDEYPLKNRIIRATGSGSGSGGGSGGGNLTGIDARIANLEAQHKAAIEKKDGKLSVSLKNQIFNLKQKKQRGEV